jgi:hypothetical protein
VSSSVGDAKRGREKADFLTTNRTLEVCEDETCDWTDDGSNYMTTRRWYPTLETLEDGTMIIVHSASAQPSTGADSQHPADRRM